MNWSIVGFVLSWVCSSTVWAQSLHPDDAEQLILALQQKPYISKYDTCADLSAAEIRSAILRAQSLAKAIPDPRSFTGDVDGFSKFLKVLGIQHFRSDEIIRANHLDVAIRCGFKDGLLLAPRCRWPSVAAKLAAADRMREYINSAITPRNWWRPKCYNSAVGGARRSDHIQGRAFDLDFINEGERSQAVLFTCDEFWQKPTNQNIQMGVGAVTLHLGFNSPRGRRCWYYASLGQGAHCRNPCQADSRSLTDSGEPAPEPDICTH